MTCFSTLRLAYTLLFFPYRDNTPGRDVQGEHWSKLVGGGQPFGHRKPSLKLLHIVVVVVVVVVVVCVCVNCCY